jgi:Flp pilus assembly protein TadG
VEFALVAPVLLILVFGVIDFGRALYVVNVLTAAMREGARRGAASGVNSSTNTPDLSSTTEPKGACPVAQGYVSTALGVTLTCQTSTACTGGSAPGANVILARYCSTDGLITVSMPGGYTFAPAAGLFSRLGTTLRPRQAVFRWELAS